MKRKLVGENILFWFFLCCHSVLSIKQYSFFYDQEVLLGMPSKFEHGKTFCQPQLTFPPSMPLGTSDNFSIFYPYPASSTTRNFNKMRASQVLCMSPLWSSKQISILGRVRKLFIKLTIFCLRIFFMQGYLAHQLLHDRASVLYQV